jgi:hypothetical protein
MAGPRAEFDAASERNRKDPNWRRHMLGTCRWGCHACGKLFGGLTGFDAHRAGAYTGEHPHYGRHCLSDDELRAKGYTLSDGVWRMPIDEADKAALAQLRKRT